MIRGVASVRCFHGNRRDAMTGGGLCKKTSDPLLVGGHYEDIIPGCK